MKTLYYKNYKDTECLKKRILITGVEGFMASRIAEYYQVSYDIIGTKHSQLDITDASMVKTILEQLSPDYVIHCAAISDINMCDQNPELSWKINVTGTKNIAAACQIIGAKLIFCSSDQVYFKNGIKTPHCENEEVKPPHLYGKQKCKAEQLALDNHPNTICLRLSMMYAVDYSGKIEHTNLIKNIITAVHENQEMSYPIFDYRSITNVWDVVKNMEKILHLPRGVYNCGCENDLSTYEIVEYILNMCGIKSMINKNQIAFADEARNLTMSNGKIGVAGILFPTTIDSLNENVKKIKELIRN